MSEDAKKPRSLAVTKVRNVLSVETPMTINAINQALPELSANQISMSLCYLRKKEIVERKQIPRVFKTGRKEIFAYTIKPSVQ